MFHKMLVAIDHSAMGRHLFNEALALAQATGGSLTLLHILSVGDEGSPVAPMMQSGNLYPGALSQSAVALYSELWQAYEAKGLSLLRSLAEEATAQGVETKYIQSLGGPGSMICEIASNLNSDLIILGRRGHTGLHELLLGSVSNYVLHHAPCSVLTIQGETQEDSGISRSSQVSFVS
jgi:nucleotide-binding universal stress UspA family protein